MTLLTNDEIIAIAGLPVDIATKLATQQGDTFNATKNEVVTALVNKICYQKVESMVFDNPFKKYDSYPVPYGDTIENVYVDRQLGSKFDKGAVDPFAKTASNVKALYATINYEMQYTATIEDKYMRKCILNEYGLMDLVNRLLQAMVTGRVIDEYLATIIMLNNSEIYAKGFEDVDVSATTDPTERAKIVTEKIIDTYTDFALPCADNNKLKVMTVTPKDRALLVIKQTLLNSINLDFLAGVFNLSKTELVKNIIPVRSFKTVVNTINGGTITPGEHGDDIDFVIIDSDGFDNHVCLQDGGLIYNPKGMYTNHFDNLWKIISFRYFYNARAFKLKTA